MTSFEKRSSAKPVAMVRLKSWLRKSAIPISCASRCCLALLKPENGLPGFLPKTCGKLGSITGFQLMRSKALDTSGSVVSSRRGD